LLQSRSRSNQSIGRTEWRCTMPAWSKTSSSFGKRLKIGANMARARAAISSCLKMWGGTAVANPKSETGFMCRLSVCASP
jgi:hypothetical protein